MSGATWMCTTSTAAIEIMLSATISNTNAAAHTHNTTNNISPTKSFCPTFWFTGPTTKTPSTGLTRCAALPGPGRPS